MITHLMVPFVISGILSYVRATMREPPRRRKATPHFQGVELEYSRRDNCRFSVLSCIHFNKRCVFVEHAVYGTRRNTANGRGLRYF